MHKNVERKRFHQTINRFSTTLDVFSEIPRFSDKGEPGEVEPHRPLIAGPRPHPASDDVRGPVG